MGEEVGHAIEHQIIGRGTEAGIALRDCQGVDRPLTKPYFRRHGSNLKIFPGICPPTWAVWQTFARCLHQGPGTSAPPAIDTPGDISGKVGNMPRSALAPATGFAAGGDGAGSARRSSTARSSAAGWPFPIVATTAGSTLLALEFHSALA